MIEKKDSELLDAISMARSENNTLWMSLVAIALEHAPERTRQTLKAINANDRRISYLLKDIVG